MNVTLSPQSATMVRRKVEDGGFGSESEVVEAALRQMEERDQRLAELRAAIAVAEEQVARGQVTLLTPELGARIWDEAMATWEAKQVARADVLA